MFGNEDSASYAGHTRSFIFPLLGQFATTLQVDGRWLCRRPDCRTCATSAECIAIHEACFDIFTQRCLVPDALSRLWVLTAWRSPWRRAWPIRFSLPPVDKAILQAMSDFSGVPLLHTLPQELVDTIRRESQGSLLWQCAEAFRLAAHIDSTAPAPLVTLPLCEIHAWGRGGRLEKVTATPSPLPILRLAVDQDGIRAIERLLTWPRYAGECSTRSVLILADDSAVYPRIEFTQGVSVQLKVRRCLGYLFPGIKKTKHPCFRLTGRLRPSRIPGPTSISDLEYTHTAGSLFLPSKPSPSRSLSNNVCH